MLYFWYRWSIPRNVILLQLLQYKSYWNLNHIYVSEHILKQKNLRTEWKRNWNHVDISSRAGETDIFYSYQPRKGSNVLIHSLQKSNPLIWTYKQTEHWTNLLRNGKTNNSIEKSQNCTFGTGGQKTLEVEQIIATWQPEFILYHFHLSLSHWKFAQYCTVNTVGDNLCQKYKKQGTNSTDYRMSWAGIYCGVYQLEHTVRYTFKLLFQVDCTVQ